MNAPAQLTPCHRVGREVIGIQQIEPGDDVGALGSAGFVEFVETGAGVRIIRGTAFLMGGPEFDFRCSAPVVGLFGDPAEDFVIAPAFGEFLFQRGRVDAGEIQELLVARAIIMVFAALAGERGAVLVKPARQNDVTAEPHARTAGDLLGKVGSVLKPKSVWDWCWLGLTARFCPDTALYSGVVRKQPVQIYFTTSGKLALWLLNSGAYMHSILATPLW